MQLLARVNRLGTVPPVVLGGFMQPVVRFRDPPLACPFIRASRRRTRQ
jgi:hypothetical protein